MKASTFFLISQLLQMGSGKTLHLQLATAHPVLWKMNMPAAE
jgi:hypothetical protein